MNNSKDFELFSRDKKVSSLTLHEYKKTLGGYINPTIVEERSMNVAVMDVFSRLMMEKIIYLGTPIDDDVCNIISSQLLYLANVDDKEITMIINSPGGSVIQGLGICDTMRLIVPDVATRCVGMAASMGAVILSCGTKEKRSSTKYSRIMIHQSSSFSEGRFTDMEIDLNFHKGLLTDIYQILSQNTGKSIEEISKDCIADKWFKSEEAKAYGLIDIVY